MTKYDVVVFNDEDLSLEVNVDKDKDTVWLTQKQMATLFTVSVDSISLHIKNILKDNELDISTIEESSTVQDEGNRRIRRNIQFYNLDMIISVGYRVNSKRGIEFRRWANKVLKSYLLEGYAINKKRLNYLEKQINLIDIESRIDEKVTSLEGNKILDVFIEYKKALDLLDDYDHLTLTKPEGTPNAVLITYEECRKIIDAMNFNSSVFGVERDESFHSSINAIYQSAFGKDVYETIEEKAANLLYFITKNHSFIDGNKRIAASIFLYFLKKNKLLYLNNEKRLSDSTLVWCYCLSLDIDAIEVDKTSNEYKKLMEVLKM
jgi:prophage maintenance system killer protein